MPRQQISGNRAASHRSAVDESSVHGRTCKVGSGHEQSRYRQEMIRLPRAEDFSASYLDEQVNINVVLRLLTLQD